MTAPEHAPHRRWRRPLVVWLGGGGLALAVVLGLALGYGGRGYFALGVTDPGPVVRLGVPVLRLWVDVAATVCLGALVFAGVLVAPRRSGVLAAEGYAALRVAGWAATAWCVGAVLMVPFDMADSTGEPLAQVVAPGHFFGLVGALEDAKAWLVTVAAAVLVAIGCRTAVRWLPVLGLLPLAGTGLLAPLMTGHASADAGHDVATDAVIWHVLAAAVWLGALVVVLAHLWRGGGQADLVLRRYRRLAWVCWLVVGISGVIDAVILVPAADLPRTWYGVLVLVSCGLLVVLGLVGAAGRRRAAAATGRRRAVRLAAVELVTLLAGVAVAVGLTRVPPPSFFSYQATAQQALIGYDLRVGVTALRLVTAWRFDVLFGTGSLLVAAVYLVGVRRVVRAGARWPAGRTVSWLAGCALVLVATSSGIGRYEPAMFSMHMAGHMILAMIAPALLAAGAPLTLALRTLPAAGTGRPVGPREALLAALHSPPVRVLTNPVVTLLLFGGSPFVLYFTGAFDYFTLFHWAHLVMDAFFLGVGWLFFWPVVGVDPLPRELPNLARLGLLLTAMPFDAFFGIAVLTTHRVIGANFYRSLALPWVHDLAADQRLGGVIAWVAGVLPVFAVLPALLAGWSDRQDRPVDPVDDDPAVGNDEAAERAVWAEFAARRR